MIADDHPALVEAVARLLQEEGITILAKVYDGAAVLAAITEHRPRVAVVDVLMPKMDGIGIATRAARETPACGVILYTGAGEEDTLRRGLRAGARGFVRKEAPLNELVHAVKVVANGGGYVDRGLAGTLVDAAADNAAVALSPREREILRLLADGRATETIAGELGISTETVRTYVQRAMRKLDADTRTQAVANALRRSLIK
ncbi:MAG: response regulator [Gaiellaceae bacterium]